MKEGIKGLCKLVNMPTVAVTPTTLSKSINGLYRGLMTRHVSVLLHVTWGAAVNPNLKFVAPGTVLKLTPVTVTAVPPLAGPFAGERPVIVGNGA